MSEIKNIIFDQDGTLYQIDGKNTGFVGSTLEKTVLENATTFLVELEKCSPVIANEIITKALQTDGGLSWYFAQQYGISREDYFNRVWTIAPSEIVQNYQTAVETVQALKLQGLTLILLTAAPSVWQRTVIAFLGLENCFSEIYTAGDFASKREIFEALSQKIRPKETLSVGDQAETDILPAAALGYQTLLVKNPSDIQKITTMLGKI